MKEFEFRRLNKNDTIKVEGNSLSNAFDRLVEELGFIDNQMSVHGEKVKYVASDLNETYVAEETLEEFRSANQTM